MNYAKTAAFENAADGPVTTAKKAQYAEIIDLIDRERFVKSKVEQDSYQQAIAYLQDSLLRLLQAQKLTVINYTRIGEPDTSMQLPQAFANLIAGLDDFRDRTGQANVSRIVSIAITHAENAMLRVVQS